MSTVSRYFQAVVAAMIVASASVTDDSPATATPLDRAGENTPSKVCPSQEQDGLDLRRPYESGKIPVVMIHGLWGKPQLWGQMVAELDADPALRQRYQFWMFRYASGDAILYSAHQLRQSLRPVRRTFDPEGTDAAFDRMVVVGHSLGGILAKMMVQESGSRLWQTVCERPTDQLAGPAEDRRLLKQAFCYSPVPEVRRVIFITTPHRGSPLATSPVRGIAAQLCDRPSRFHEALRTVEANNKPDLFTRGFVAKSATSTVELVPGHPLLLALCDLKIDPSVLCHSIVADLRDPPCMGATDGIVPYWSSRLEGVESELLVHGLHFCLTHPAVIREVRRILVEHVKQ